jgi:hypothetical protein
MQVRSAEPSELDAPAQHWYHAWQAALSAP